MIKKRLLTIFFATVCLLSLTVASYAATIGWSPSVSWDSTYAKKNFSPEYGNTAMYGYTDTSNQLWVKPQARFNFSTARIANIHNYANLDDWYYTFDISCTNDNNTTVSAAWDFYSDLPDPYFDVDDDPYPGNGYYDESEVVSLTPTSMLPNTDYRFNSHFRVYMLETTLFDGQLITVSGGGHWLTNNVVSRFGVSASGGSHFFKVPESPPFMAVG